MLLGQAAARRSASLYCLEFSSVGNAAADAEDDLPQGHAHGHFDQAGALNFAGQREDLGSLAARGTHGGEPLAAVADDGGNVGEGFDVVDERGIAPQAGDSRIGRPRTGWSALAFDGGNQRCFFAADKGTGAETNVDVEVEGGFADSVAEEPAAARLTQSDGKPLDGERIFRADIDVAFGRADGVGRDGHAFNDALRIALEHAAIHERAGIALVAIADDIFLGAFDFGDVVPLEAGWITAASTAAETAFGDLLDHRGRVHVGEGFHEPFVAAARDVFVDLFGIDVAGILENDVGLTIEVAAEVRIEARYGLFAQRSDYVVRVAFVHVAVAGFGGFDQDQGPGGAQAHAPGAAHMTFLLAAFGCFFQSSLYFVAVLGEAAGAHADIDLVVELLAFFDSCAGNLVEFLIVHCIVHLSSCLVSSAASMCPESSPSRRTTGARPHAPTQRAVVKETSPSGVVSPAWIWSSF